MATKEEALAYVKEIAAQKIATKTEVFAAYEAGSDAVENVLIKKIGIAEILYYIGGAIVFLGI